jgi:hypothetical protein
LACLFRSLFAGDRAVPIPRKGVKTMSAFASVAVPAVNDAASVISTATTDLLPTLLTVGGAGIAVGAGVLILRRGWGFFKGMIK